MTIGIDSIGLKIPSYVIEAVKIGALYDIPERKIIEGLGCDKIALCLNDETVVDLATQAAERALSRFDGTLDDIGLIAVGTETSLDESRPLSAWIADRLGLKGHVRSYEVKHACYGGTLALRQAVEWRASRPDINKKALVIAADICTYPPGHPAEVTGGAGSVAMIVGEGKKASIDIDSYPYSVPRFDFWRPTGDDFPQVEGKESLNAYILGLEKCYEAFFGDNPDTTLDDFFALCFHIPFPKMVITAFRNLCQKRGLSEEDRNRLIETKISPFMTWNKEVGNSYTASLWMSVADALSRAKEQDRIACFSYGSGFGSELITLTRTKGESDWRQDMEQDLKNRQTLTIDDYQKWQKETPKRRGQPKSS